jgi:hypothetical protein
MLMEAGATTSTSVSIGGVIYLRSGRSTAASSGSVVVSSAPAAAKGGTSGDLVLQSGTAGSSGSVAVASSDAVKGRSGDINMEVGSSVSKDGASFNVVGGAAQHAGVGGRVSFRSGDVSNVEGGTGGNVLMSGGSSRGKSVRSIGGNVQFRAGRSAIGRGGTIHVQSGRATGAKAKSGRVEVSSANSGSLGVSGRLGLRTGKSSGGSTGRL